MCASQDGGWLGEGCYRRGWPRQYGAASSLIMPTCAGMAGGGRALTRHREGSGGSETYWRRAFQANKARYFQR